MCLADNASYSYTQEMRYSHHHQCRIADRGHCIAPTAWPRRMARLQSSTGELLKSRQIWSMHRAQGLPGRRLQLGPGG